MGLNVSVGRAAVGSCPQPQNTQQEPYPLPGTPSGKQTTETEERDRVMQSSGYNKHAAAPGYQKVGSNHTMKEILACPHSGSGNEEVTLCRKNRQTHGQGLESPK